MNSKLRTARAALRKTLSEVASDLSMDVGNLSRIERGKQKPHFKLAKRISEYYLRNGQDISLLDIYQHEENTHV